MISDILHKWIHKSALFIRPLRVGILSPLAFNLWYLTRHLDMPSGYGSPASRDNLKLTDAPGSAHFKYLDLKALRAELLLIASQDETGGSHNKNYLWASHPLVEVRYQKKLFFGIKLIVISAITSKYFDSNFYLSKNPHVRQHNENPLSHYVVYGFFALLQPSDGVFNSSPEADWGMRELSLAEKRDYLWNQAHNRSLLVPTNSEELDREASSLIAIADSETAPQIKTHSRAKFKDDVAVSVIIPCFEQARFLHECLESVARATHEFHECIIIDDGNQRAEDLAILALVTATAPHQNILLHKQKNLGIAGARNAGLILAQGKYIKFLDADDLLTPESIDVQIREMVLTGAHADVGGYQVISDSRDVLSENVGPISELPKSQNQELEINALVARWEQSVALPIHSLLVQRDFVQATETALRSKEDFRMWLELAATQTTFSTSVGVVALYRKHDKQMTSGSRARHGLYFLEALYDCDVKHHGLIDIEVLRSKIDYINDFYGSAPSRAWRSHSASRSAWLESLGK